MTGHDAAGRRENHLAGQTSPYLLQHLHNPVDWYPWGPAALERARNEDRPIFLSIGYAACHWCHVMERESFENPSVAAMLNEHFVSIKVDREERPDIDDVYMSAVQMLTGQGGWPLTVFLTPELEPFFGGTYFPPDERFGRIGFGSLLERIRDAWTGQRSDVARSAGEVALRLKKLDDSWTEGGTPHPIEPQLISSAARELSSRFDSRWGGFGNAPKFPPDGSLALLLRESARSGECILSEVVEKTLDGMATGGMYDHVGGGFARYSVDERWLVPHFEKMLYNQALLVPVYADGWRVMRKPLYRRIVEQTLDFVRRELTSAEGGFLASLDADSEGVEGKFYVWTPAQVREVLDAKSAEQICELYDIRDGGNFEGASIPNLIGGSLAERAAARGTDEESLARQVAPALDRLRETRAGRVWPATDDKVLTAWNGLMIGACSRAYQTFGRGEDLESAVRAAEFVTTRLSVGGRLQVTWRQGRARLNGYLDDYAFVGRGLLDLYEACFERRWLDRSVELARTLVARFEDRERGGFFFTSDDHEDLLTRNRSLHDGALPAGSAVAAELLIRLAAHTGDDELRQAAERTFRAYAPAVERLPSAFSTLLLAVDLASEPLLELAIVGAPGDAATEDLLGVARARADRRIAVQVGPPGATEGLTLLEGKTCLDGQPTAYVCRAGTCLAPTNDPEELRRLLDRA